MSNLETMKLNSLYIFSFIASALLLGSCEKETKDALVPFPEDITFNELELGRFSFEIPSSSIRSGSSAAGFITANVQHIGGTSFNGFALSNKNFRSYPWTLSPDFAPGALSPAQKQAAIDSTRFSVYTSRPNMTQNYLVAHAVDDQAFITLEQPTVVEHVLVANTTYTYLLTTHGSVLSGTMDQATQRFLLTGTKVPNPNIPSPAVADYGRWWLPGPDDAELIRLDGHSALSGNPGYVKLLILGFQGGAQTGQVEFFLAVRTGGDPSRPTASFTRADWYSVDLTELGKVDKLLFRIEGSYTDASGNLLTPPYFCLDGIRLRK